MLLSILSRILLLPLFSISFFTFNILDLLAARFKKSMRISIIIIIISIIIIIIIIIIINFLDNNTMWVSVKTAG
jgi:hypothetical protein